MKNSLAGSILLIALILLVLLPGRAHHPSPTTCSYTKQRVATRQLLQYLDHALPGVVETQARHLQGTGHADEMPFIDVKSCFTEFAVDQAFSVTDAPLTSRLMRQLQRGYSKSLGPTGHLDVLEYATGEAAAAAKVVQDSLVAQCQQPAYGTVMNIERCADIDLYRVTRHKACLVRYFLYSNDPLQRVNLRSLRTKINSLL